MTNLPSRRRQFQIWRSRRLQQYADRSGLSLQLVQVLLSYPPSHRSFRVVARDIDRKVDPDFKLENMPSL